MNVVCLYMCSVYTEKLFSLIFYYSLGGIKTLFSSSFEINCTTTTQSKLSSFFFYRSNNNKIRCDFLLFYSGLIFCFLWFFNPNLIHWKITLEQTKTPKQLQSTTIHWCSTAVQKQFNGICTHEFRIFRQQKIFTEKPSSQQ